MFIALADIHINTRRDLHYEIRRIKELGEVLSQAPECPVVCCGDTFDRNDPLLIDLHLFYELCKALHPRPVHIFAGNHDYKVMQYLYGGDLFTVHKAPGFVEELQAYVLPWDHLQTFHKLIDRHTNTKLLLTHARCTIPPFIEEEFPIEELSKTFELTVLGDIHMPLSPFPNVIYPSSPNNLDFTTYKPNSNGYLIVNTDLTTIRVPLDLPHREKRVVTEVTKDELAALDKRHLYKLMLEAEPGDMPKIRALLPPYVKVEFIPKVDRITEGLDEKLQEFLSSKMSIEDMLFQALADRDQKQINKIRQRLKG
jgi:DNA repair exonuclease SbcCD nuclease subunit